VIPYGRQDINDNDIAAVIAVLKSDFLTQGPVVPRFEDSIAERVGAAHAVAVNSATSALHLAMAALDVGPGDLVWTTPNTFVASANCARYCGADVDFVDIDPTTYNMCAYAYEEKLIDAARNGRLPKVIIPVHMCGQSPDMLRLSALSKPHGIRIVEDASHAIGAQYADHPVGACALSDITVFSFHPVKIVTTGEGGIATTNDTDLAQRMQMLRSHGITRDETLMQGPSDGGWYYQQLELGWNYRMSELQAALGLSQLDRLEEFVEARNVLAQRYDKLLSNLPVQCPARLDQAYSAFHLYIIRLNISNRNLHRTVFEDMRTGGIGVNLHYIPVHLHPYYRDLGFGEGDFPQTEAYYRQAISLPLYPKLTKTNQDQVVQVLEASLQRHSV
jgi:UDP-4-amino-4,6-dideoxy-N-acetyl-beta-L-altrosamine transaminase